jgi:TRAP-type C4-dicarboxylate transport system substrate-binding protein
MIKKIIIVFLGTSLIFLFSTVNAVAAEPGILKFGTHLPPGSVMSVVVTSWIKQVEKDAEGTLKVQTFFGGGINRDAAKQYELLVNGIQDASIVLPSFTEELFPDFTLFSIPYLIRNAEEGSIAHWRMYEKGLLGGLEKVYPVAIASHGNSALHFATAIKSAEDIKGMKIRATGPQDTAIIKSMGAVAVGMEMSQVAEALNRGLVQGNMSGWSANQTFRLTPLLKSHYEEPYGVQTYLFIISKKAYDSLPAKAKQAIDKHSGLAFSRECGKAFDDSVNELRKVALADPKVNVITVSEAEQKKRFAQIYKPFHDEWLNKYGSKGKRNYDALMNILADIRK